MLRFTVLIALVALSVAWPSSSEEKDSKMEGPERMNEYQKWKMMEEKDKKMSQYEGFKKFLMFKEKMEMMEELAKKKAVYKDFLKYKAYKEKSEQNRQGSMEQEGESDEQMMDKKDEEKKFEMMMENFNEASKKHVMGITAAFLKICKSQNAAGLELKELFEKQEGTKDEGMSMFDMEELNFNGNMTAKAEFVKKLEPEQKKKMLVHGLVKSMCGGAKTFVSHVKEFKEKYMKSME